MITGVSKDGSFGAMAMEEFFERARVGMAIRDESGRLVRANAYYYQLLGKTADELVGTDLTMNVPTESLPRAYEHLRRILAGEPQESSEWELVRKDGSRAIVQGSPVEVIEIDGKKFLFGTILDVTAIRTAERQAEEQRRHIEFVSEATRRLAESLDYETTLRGIADLAVEHLADWCSIDMLGSNGEMTRLHVAHPDSEMVELAYEMQRRFPPDKKNPNGAYQVMKRGVSQLISEITDEMIEGSISDPWLLEAMHRAKIRSSMMVPLLARHEPVGVITFVSGKPNYYGPPQLTLAEELARAAGFAIENSRLYSEARAELAERRRAEAALGESERRFKLALRGSSIVVFSLDLDLRFTWAHNPQLVLSPEAIIGNMPSEVLGEESGHRMEELAREVISTGTGQKAVVELEYRRRSRFFEMAFEPDLDADGNLVGVTCAAIDVSDRKRNEENQAFLVRLTDVKRSLSAPDDVLGEVAAQLGKYLHVERCAFSQILDNEIRVAREYSVNEPSFDGTYPLSDFNSELLDIARRGETVAIEDVTQHPQTKDQVQKYQQRRTAAQLVVPLVRDGVLVATLGLYSESPRRWTPSEIHLVEQVADRAWSTVGRARAEYELWHLNQELERKVEERTSELKEANRELESFSYSVSHDLRAPLRSIMSASMILLEDYGERLDDDGRAELRKSAAAAKRMATLIDDLLQYSRLGRREILKERIDLTTLGENIAQELSAKGAASDVEVNMTISPDMETEADPVLMRVVVQNLLENAYKFSVRAASPRVEFTSVEKDGRTIFVVKDNGIGFDPQYASKLFQPFERLHSPTEYPGTGIGLANVKRVVERHGGKIWAEGEPGKGAAFFFYL